MEQMEKKTCLNPNCDKELPNDSKRKFCKECRKKMILGSIPVVTAAVASGAVYVIKKLLINDALDEDSDQTLPQLPVEYYEWILQHRGKEEADWAFDNVQKEQWSVDDVERRFMKPEKGYDGYKPDCCRGCNPAYPLCRSSCNVFDE